MDPRPTEARKTAPRKSEAAAMRAKATRRRRQAGAAQAAVEAAETTASPERRQRELIALLFRVAEAQTRALEQRETPVPATELKATVDVLERLQRMQAAAAGSAPDPGEGRSLIELRDELHNRLSRARRERELVEGRPPGSSGWMTDETAG